MEDLDYWRVCDELSIIQAALLIAGRNPSSDAAYVERLEPENRPVGYEAAKIMRHAEWNHSGNRK